jgi:SAM-dependent methyltransferase
VLELLRRHGIERGRVIEVGCGSGVLARELAQAGYEVIAFDASEAMIELALASMDGPSPGAARHPLPASGARGNAVGGGPSPRRPDEVPNPHAVGGGPSPRVRGEGGRRPDEGPNPQFKVAPFETAPLSRCDAIIAMGEVLNYGDIRTFLPRAAKAARFLLFDIAEKASYPAYAESRVGGEDWSVIAIKESDGTRLTRRVLTFRQIGGETRRDEEIHHLELYDRAEILELLEGFRVRVRRSYGSRRLPAGHAVYVATR